MELLFFLFGIVIAFISAFIPGMHSNTIISIFSSFGIDPAAFAFFIIGLFPAHMIFSFVPSIFFGIPEQRTVISVLPGQRLVLEGRGIFALKTVLLSCILAMLLSFFFFPFSLSFFEFSYNLIHSYIGYILLLFSIVFLSRTKNIPLSLFVFVLAGMLGYISFRSGIEDPFLPLFSGMFALGAILNYQKSKIPVQKDERAQFGPDMLKFVLLGTVLGLFADLLPGISSPSQVATFLTIFMPINTLGYLAAISSISMSEAVFSFATSASIDKSRMGATASLAKLLPVGENLVLIMLLFFISIAVAVAIAYSLRRHIAKISNIDFSELNILIALYLLSIVFVLDGVAGVFIFVLASALGFLTVRFGAERTNLMGAVIVPTILLLFRIFI